MTHKILLGNCLEVLGTLEPGSIQTCVTSPPYWGLRDYGTAKWIGGDPNCEHSEKRGGNGSASTKQVTSAGTQTYQYRGVCPKCGALREDSQIGLEETPEEYVNHLVEVFRGVRRALRDDGTLWLNLGDSYAGSGGAGDWSLRKGLPGKEKQYAQPRGNNPNRYAANASIKPKDLVGIPWMVAFALRADGWYLRSEIIWHKPNPMPESVTDRPTKAHEQIFLLSKSPKYYYDAEAIAEPTAPESAARYGRGSNYDGSKPYAMKQGPRGSKRMKNLLPDGQSPNSFHLRRAEGLPDEEYSSRNKRSVWTVSTKPFKGAHFATFPPDLIEPCVLAGSRPGDTVLDPFNGAGTTGFVSIKHNRNYLGIELNPAYIELTEDRFSEIQPHLFGSFVNA